MEQPKGATGLRALYNKLIPVNARSFTADILGNQLARLPGPIGVAGAYIRDMPTTNQNFTDEQLMVLREAALTAIDKGKGSINYKDYPVYKDGSQLYDRDNDTFVEKMRDPNFQARTTIGGANVSLNNKNEIILTDRFNYNNTEDLKDLEELKVAVADIKSQESNYEKLRSMGKYFGSGPEEGSPVNLNLGQYPDYATKLAQLINKPIQGGNKIID